MNLFNFFKRKTNTPVSNKEMIMDPNSLFYHEDDFCQIELVPNNNIENLTSELEKIKEFSEAHANGIGYSDIYVRKENNYPLRDKKIKTAELMEFLDNLGVEKFSKVYTGYGSSYRIISEDTIGYGVGYSSIYFDFKEDIVQNIWMTNPWNFDKKKCATVLNKVGLRWNLVLIDWSSDIMVNLTDILSIEVYLRLDEE